jgi:hypothetical protein
LKSASSKRASWENQFVRITSQISHNSVNIDFVEDVIVHDRVGHFLRHYSKLNLGSYGTSPAFAPCHNVQNSNSPLDFQRLEKGPRSLIKFLTKLLHRHM